MTSHTGLPTGSAYPTRDEDGNLLTTEFGLCVYKNHQTVTVQARARTHNHCLAILPGRGLQAWQRSHAHIFGMLPTPAPSAALVAPASQH